MYAGKMKHGDVYHFLKSSGAQESETTRKSYGTLVW